MAVGGASALMLLWASAPHVHRFIEMRAWLVMFLRKLYRPLSCRAKFWLGSFNLSLSTCLNEFHSGLLSKRPEESADGEMTTIFVIIITITFITIIGFGAQGRSIAMEGGGGAGGNPHHREPQGGGGGGPSSAAPYIYIYIYKYISI